MILYAQTIEISKIKPVLNWTGFYLYGAYKEVRRFISALFSGIAIEKK